MVNGHYNKHEIKKIMTTRPTKLERGCFETYRCKIIGDEFMIEYVKFLSLLNLAVREGLTFDQTLPCHLFNLTEKQVINKCRTFNKKYDDRIAITDGRFTFNSKTLRKFIKETPTLLRNLEPIYLKLIESSYHVPTRYDKVEITLGSSIHQSKGVIEFDTLDLETITKTIDLKQANRKTESNEFYYLKNILLESHTTFEITFISKLLGFKDKKTNRLLRAYINDDKKTLVQYVRFEKHGEFIDRELLVLFLQHLRFNKNSEVKNNSIRRIIILLDTLTKQKRD